MTKIGPAEVSTGHVFWTDNLFYVVFVTWTIFVKHYPKGRSSLETSPSRKVRQSLYQLVNNCAHFYLLLSFHLILLFWIFNLIFLQNISCQFRKLSHSYFILRWLMCFHPLMMDSWKTVPCCIGKNKQTKEIIKYNFNIFWKWEIDDNY